MLWYEERKKECVWVWYVCKEHSVSVKGELFSLWVTSISLQVFVTAGESSESVLHKCFSRQLVEHAWKKQTMPMK